MTENTPIYVTQPTLPALEEFVPYLEQIWANKVLTNGGPFHRQLESALGEYLGVEHISLFSNGTLALITALQSLGVTGEVITTPYSFVATAHSLLWNQLTPVFVDVDPVTLNMDPARIEAAITERTAAILPVHCYGNPADVDAIDAIAKRHGLKVVYDAAHAFGVRDAGGSVLRHGDLAILSFHATKVFNTFEGGAVISPDRDTKLRIDQLKNFGIVDEVTVTEAGMNGKVSEINAAFGLLQLGKVDQAIAARAAVDRQYRTLLAAVPGVRCVEGGGATALNYSYFPVLIEPAFGMSRDAVFALLKEHGIFGRRYFYPLISSFPMYSALPSAAAHNLPVAAAAAEQVLCLPIYPTLAAADVARIVSIIAGAAR